MHIRFRLTAALLVAVTVAPTAFAGHTRPGYVDGCQSADGRYVVTAESKKDPRGEDGWEFTWLDKRTNETHKGWLVGVPYGLEHFRVAYTHIFVPPGGETFAVWQPASFAPCNRKPPGASEKKIVTNPSDDFKNYNGFADRLVIYKKTGEVMKRLAMKDLLRDNEWMFVNWVHGNLYWLTEYADVMKPSGEPPRCGYRYYRVSPDYSVLEFTAGPNSDAKHKVKEIDPALVNYRRTVRVSLVDGSLLDPDSSVSDSKKVPVTPFQGDLLKRGDAMKNYVPSLDPVRCAGSLRPSS